MDQARSCPVFLDFLIWHLEEEYAKNTFNEGYGETRAKADGKAEQVVKLYNLIKEEDFDLKTKDIKFDVNKQNNKIITQIKKELDEN